MSVTALTGSLNFMKRGPNFQFRTVAEEFPTQRALAHTDMLKTLKQNEKTRSLTLNVHVWKWAAAEERWKSRNKYGKKLKKKVRTD